MSAGSWSGCSYECRTICSCGSDALVVRVESEVIYADKGIFKNDDIIEGAELYIRGEYEFATDAAKVYATAAGVGLGLAMAAPAAPAAISTVALKVTMETNIAAVSFGMYAAKNPEKVENAIGIGVSFAQGLTAGLTDTKNVPAQDGTYTPGLSHYNYAAGEFGTYIGRKIRSNYVEKP